MNDKDDRPGNATELRRKAEEIVWRKAAQVSEDLESLSPKKVRQMLYELQVHQIELEMQNEELRRTQQELEVSRVGFFELFDLAPVGYMTISEQGVILKGNLTAAAMLGEAKSVLIKQPLSHFILPEDQDLYYLHHKKIFRTGARQTCELRMKKKGGSLLWVGLEATVVQDPDGSQVSRIVLSDITERKRTEEALQQAHDELEQRVAARTEELWQANKDLQSEITERKRVEEALLESENNLRWLNEHILNMVMVLSHDVRGPLISIIAILKLLFRGSYGKLDQNLANTIKDLLSRCLRLLGTAEDYIGRASIVHGSVKMEREGLDLRQDIIDTVLDELADDITKHEIVIDNRLGTIPAGSIAISANKTWLKAVYRNLFTNAIKYGGMGCTISFGFESHESHYRLNVYNSGNPIPEQNREKLFVRFGRIETEGRISSDGVGLGLSLCQEIILDHGGEIWYEALPNGSNFVFTISREEVIER